MVNNTTSGQTKATEYAPLLLSNTFQNMYIPRKPAIIEIANITNNLGVMWVLIFLRSWLAKFIVFFGFSVVDDLERLLLLLMLLLSINTKSKARIGKPNPILSIYISMGSNDFSRYCLATIVVIAHANPDINAN